MPVHLEDVDGPPDPAFPTAWPDPRTPDPMLAPPLRWGVVAPGGIAGSFVTALREHTRQQVVAVGSRSSDRAARFAADHGIERSYGSYDQVYDDPQVDVVYVASPHSEHHRQALDAIAAGKPVLVEKAFTRNATEAREVTDAAAAAGVAVLEAMWTRFLPYTDVVRQLLADGVLGDVQTVMADHGEYFVPDPSHRLFDPGQAGGALLDLGIYPISFACFVLGGPETVTAIGDLASTGVEAQVSAVLRTGQAQALTNCTMTARTPITASISGTAARLEITGTFYAPAPLTLTHRDGRTLHRPTDAIIGKGGLAYEAAHLAALLSDGATASPLLPPAETVEIMTTLDEIRRQIGVSFPGE